MLRRGTFQGRQWLWLLMLLSIVAVSVAVRTPSVVGGLEEVAAPEGSGSRRCSHSDDLSERLAEAVADGGARVVSETWLDSRTVDLVFDTPSVAGNPRARVLLPPAWNDGTASCWPVLYLMHGGGGAYTNWTDRTDVEELSAQWNVIVVMPDAAVGFCSDAWNGGQGGPPAWETFHTVELRQILERAYSASGRRGIAGLSMGGYCAMQYASTTGLFRAAASYSGLLHPTYFPELIQALGMWGDPVAQRDVWEAHDPWFQAEQLRGVTLYLSTGDGRHGPLDDEPPAPHPLDDNSELFEYYVGTQTYLFALRLAELDVKVTIDLYGAGTHTWPYWQRALHDSFPLLMDTLHARSADA
jgi:diacylglycerol O-acyltransferase/trehalose O-mycolyltransferase